MAAKAEPLAAKHITSRSVRLPSARIGPMEYANQELATTKLLNLFPGIGCQGPLPDRSSAPVPEPQFHAALRSARIRPSRPLAGFVVGSCGWSLSHSPDQIAASVSDLRKS